MILVQAGVLMKLSIKLLLYEFDLRVLTILFYWLMFAGTFGHCTPKGNGLLATNIADAIFKEILSKQMTLDD